MDTQIIKKAYKSRAERITALCEGITQTEATFRPYDKANSLVWELGHVISVRNTIIKILNPDEKLDVLPNEREMFGNGSVLFEAEAYPALTDLVALLNSRGERMYELLDSVSAEHWNAESFLKIPSLGNTVGELIFSFMIHEAAHYGEMTIIKTLIHRLR